MRNTILLCLIASTLTLAAFAQARPSGVRVGEEFMRTQLEKRVDPIYPQAALKAGSHGLLELQIRITKTGDVKYVQVGTGDPALAPSAIEAVKQWRYKPYLLNGVPVEVSTKVTLSYEVSPGKSIVHDAPIRTSKAKQN